jgi:hypothetical protein
MRRCHCDRNGCRLCWLAANDPRYRTLWGVEGSSPLTGKPWAPKPAERPKPECIYLGVVLDRLGCQCVGKWVRGCEKHGQCTTRTKRDGVTCCAGCPDYEADE